MLRSFANALYSYARYKNQFHVFLHTKKIEQCKFVIHSRIFIRRDSDNHCQDIDIKNT